jgi:hypothetical protein
MIAGVADGLKSMGEYSISVMYADLKGLVVTYDTDEEQFKFIAKDGNSTPSFRLDKDFEDMGMTPVPHREHPQDVIGSSIYITSFEPKKDLKIIKKVLSKYVNADMVEYTPF